MEHREESKMATAKTKSKTPAKSAALPPNHADGVNANVLTASEAAAYLRVPEPDLLLMACSGELPGRKIGAQWRFYKPALQQWLGVTAGKKGLLSQLGALGDDPHLEAMLSQIYKRRGRSETENG
jgi:excisionase family DNA binding protein